jgi:virginiamycin B lyase
MGPSSRSAPVARAVVDRAEREALRLQPGRAARRRAPVEAAGLNVRLERVLPGRRSGKRCVAPTKGLTRARAKRCTSTVKVTTFTRGGGLSGLNSTSFDAKAGEKALKPGSYRAVLTAADAADDRSTATTAALRVVK